MKKQICMSIFEVFLSLIFATFSASAFDSAQVTENGVKTSYAEFSADAIASAKIGIQRQHKSYCQYIELDMIREKFSFRFNTFQSDYTIADFYNRYNGRLFLTTPMCLSKLRCSAWNTQKIIFLETAFFRSKPKSVCALSQNRKNSLRGASESLVCKESVFGAVPRVLFAKSQSSEPFRMSFSQGVSLRSASECLFLKELAFGAVPRADFSKSLCSERFRVLKKCFFA